MTTAVPPRARFPSPVGSALVYFEDAGDSASQVPWQPSCAFAPFLEPAETMRRLYTHRMLPPDSAERRRLPEHPTAWGDLFGFR